ncbi:hypothetical protein [Lysobacter gummosus]
MHEPGDDRRAPEARAKPAELAHHVGTIRTVVSRRPFMESIA